MTIRPSGCVLRNLSPCAGATRSFSQRVRVVCAASKILRQRKASRNVASHWRSAVQKIVTFLWFDSQAEEAANFYVSLFKNSEITSVHCYGEAGPGPKGSVMMVNLQLEGQQFMALNGGPHFKFTPAISLFVNCETQEEVDAMWDKLSAGGRKDRCGWLQDKYGLSLQIIPTALGRLMSDPDQEKSSRVMKAMLQMDKIDVNKLEKAYEDPAA